MRYAPAEPTPRTSPGAGEEKTRPMLCGLVMEWKWREQVLRVEEGGRIVEDSEVM